MKGYKDTKHSLNCPPNSLSKMGTKGGSKETVSPMSLSKKAVPAAGGTRPKGFAFGQGK